MQRMHEESLKIKIITYLYLIKEYNTIQCGANSDFKNDQPSNKHLPVILYRYHLNFTYQ
jgi:hypothetical protein